MKTAIGVTLVATLIAGLGLVIRWLAKGTERIEPRDAAMKVEPGMHSVGSEHQRP